MSAMTKILTGAAGLAAVAGFASPAAAQYYPQSNSGGVLGAIINSVIGGGYGQYGYGNYGYNQTNDRYAVDQCTRAVAMKLNGQGNYGAYGSQYGYSQYGSQYANARIAGITRVERRSNGGLKVYGVAQSNAYAGGYNQPYGGYNQQYGGYNQQYGYNQPYGGYNQAYGAGGSPDLKFNCKVSSRGQITDVDIDRMNTYNRNDYYYGYRR